MANLGSATLMVNVACEMVYIVSQKLHDQGYSPDDGARCLCGLLGALSHPSFVETLFALKQNSTSAANSVNESDDILNDRQALQDVLQQLCACSFLRLGEDSMSLMLDNQLMMFKYQVMSASSLTEVTINHLQEMFKIAELAGNQAVLSSLVDLKSRFEAAFNALTIGDSADLRMRILAFLQDKRYEARMMLEDGKMAEDYGINYNMNCSEGMPAHSEKPGTIRFFDNKGANWRSKSFDPMAVSMGSFPPPEDFFDSVPADPPLGCDMFAAYEPDTSEMMSPTTPHTAADMQYKMVMQNMTPEQRAAADLVETLAQGSSMFVEPGTGSNGGSVRSNLSGDGTEAHMPPNGMGEVAAEGDMFDMMMARNDAVAAALKSLDNVMSNLPAAKIPGPKYDPHNPDGENISNRARKQSGSSSSSSSYSVGKKKSAAEDDLLGKLDQLAAVTEQPSTESLMSALSDLSNVNTGGNDAETLEAMDLLNSVAAKSTNPELNTGLSEPSSSEMEEALASLNNLAGGSSSTKPADDLSAQLLALEAHPDKADVDALNMLDSVAQSKLDKEGQQSLNAEELSSVLAGLGDLGDSNEPDLGKIDLSSDASFISLSEKLASLDTEGLATVDDDLSLPKSPTFDLHIRFDEHPNTDDSKSGLPQSGVFDLSGLDLSALSKPEDDDDKDKRPIANSAVFDISDLQGF